MVESVRGKQNTTRWFLSVCLGGAWGGGLAGLAEAVLIAATSSGEEYGLFPFALLWYGGLGLAVALACGVAVFIMQALRRRALPGAFAIGVAPALGSLFVVVARYHVNQRIFAEQLVTASVRGIAVHLGLVAAALILAGIVVLVARRLQQARHGLLGGSVAFLVLLAACVAGAWWSMPRIEKVVRTATAPADRPNVILIVVDTLRADALGVQGGPHRKTPHIDAFARDAVRFSQAYTQSSWTRPSIASILTSLYPSRHGAILKLDPLPDEVDTMAEILRREGFWTAGFVSNINVAPVFNFQQGFAEYNYLAPRFYFGATDSATRLAIYKGLRLLRERFFGHRMYFYHYYQDAAVVNQAVMDWLAQKPPSPFFLLIHYMDPHDPFFEIPYNGRGVARVSTPSPPKDQAPELRRLYDQDVTYLDDHLQALLEKLRALGLYDRSVIALTADHGEEFQEHGGWWHGTTLYEEQVHVPLLIRLPRDTRAGTVETRPVRSVDIMPTLLAAAGVDPAPEWQGANVFAPDVKPPAVLFAEEKLEGNIVHSLRREHWKLITANAGNPRGLAPVELYDLATDPGETRNVVDQYPELAQDLLRQLAERQRAVESGGK